MDPPNLWFAKAVPNVAVSEQIGWVCRIVFEFLTEVTDENPQISAFIAEAGTTQNSKQSSMADRTARMRHQKVKSVELARGEMYLDPSTFNTPSNGVEHDSSV